MRAVRFVLFGNACTAVRAALDTTSAVNFIISTRDGALPAVFVVRTEDLAALRQFAEVVVDRHTKSKSKSLSYYMLGHRRVPILAGSHTRPGQLKRSIRTLLSHAQDNEERKAYIVGVDEALYNELWDDADVPAVPDRPTLDADTGEPTLDPSPEIEPPGLVELYKGDTPQVRNVRQMALRYSRHDKPVLLTGEPGTGKSLLARAIHANSRRSGQVFLRFDCAASAPEFVTTDLFGDDRVTKESGAPPAKGVWERAHGGTLLLAGITELSDEVQLAVLRAVNEHKVRRVGALEDIDVDVRLIAATSRDLNHLVERHQFNSRLYDAIRRHAIRTPPLREHKADLPEYISFYWRYYTGDDNAKLRPDIVKELLYYNWPDNMRGLKTVLANLHATSDTRDPELKQLHAVVLFRGGMLGSGEFKMDESDARLRWIRCVQHLRRANEIVSSCKFTLRHILEGHDPDSPEGSFEIHDVGRLLGELDELFHQPTRFGSERTFREVHDLHGTMRVQFHLLQRDIPAAINYWRNTMEPAFDPVKGVLAGALQRAVYGDCGDESWTAQKSGADIERDILQAEPTCDLPGTSGAEEADSVADRTDAHTE